MVQYHCFFSLEEAAQLLEAMALSDIAAGCREAGEAWQSLRESLSLADVSHWVSPLDPPPADPRAARGAG